MRPGATIRGARRFPAVYPVIFGGAPFVGEGRLMDLSLTGCSVETDRTVLQDSYIRLNMIVPGHGSLSVDLARVRWVRKTSFGVEFIRLPAIAKEQLDRNGWERVAVLLEGRQ
jgi:hypothetical protein